MPAYSATTIPNSIYKGDSVTVWNAEQPASSAASVQVAIGPSFGIGSPCYASVEISFNASPGTFEIDIQEADTDADQNYLGPIGGAITTTTHNGSFYVFRMDLNNPVTANFLRLFMKTAPTYSGASPTVTAKIFRQ